MNEYSIERIKQPMQELVEPIRRLLGQLTTKDVEFDMEVLQKIVQSPSSELFILRGEEVVGMLSIGIYSSPTGRKVWVEENIGWMALVLAVVMIVPLIIRTIKRTRMEVEIYERSKVGK